jgi:general secretion pathway protein B
MSFILDALKKSELERQRQSVPGLMDTPSRTRRNRLPIWAIALAVLLVVNLGVLTFVLMKRGTPPVATATPPADARTSNRPPAAPAPGPSAAQTRPFSPMDSSPVYAPEIPVTDAPVAKAPASSPGAAAAPPPARSAHREDPLLTDAAPDEPEETLPSISEINLTGSQALPELHLDVHVYATKPSERFVYINMRKYHEGAVLQEGPKLERIRRDGVVLDYQGLRFLLPRQP